MTDAPAINYKLGNEKLIKVLPNAATKLTGLLTRQGRAEHGALRVAVVGGGGALACNTKWTSSMAPQTGTSWSSPAMCVWSSTPRAPYL